MTKRTDPPDARLVEAIAGLVAHREWAADVRKTLGGDASVRATLCEIEQTFEEMVLNAADDVGKRKN
jgi:hypothetical protein